MTVTMVTTIDDESILYEVYTGYAMSGDFNTVHQVWQKEVPSGRGERFRAGGHAFVTPACEQQEVAESSALMPYETAKESPAGDETMKNFWIVTKPQTAYSELEDICFECDWERLRLQFLGGLEPSEIYDMY